MELKSEERSINGTSNEIFSAFKHVFFHSGKLFPSSDSCWSILGKTRTGWEWFFASETEPGLTWTLPSSVTGALQQLTWLWNNSAWWICINEFASNLIRRAHLPQPLPFELWPWSYTWWWGKPVCKTGDCYANDHCICSFFFFFSVNLGTHYLLDILSSGGSKPLYLPNPSVNTDRPTPLHHTWSAPPVMPKNMILVANGRESHENYLLVICLVCLQHWERI